MVLPERRRLRAALLDVGGTLWHERLSAIQGRDDLLIGQLRRRLPALSREQAIDLLAEFDVCLTWRTGEHTQDTDSAVKNCAAHVGLDLSAGDATLARKALCVPVFGHVELFAGASDLLRAIKARNLRSVVISNGVTRDAETYLEDFKALGVDPYIDAVISSVDVGFLKPHAAIFAAALRAVECRPEECVMIGNSEENDIAPAHALGMRTVRVCIEEPPDEESAADAVVTSLAGVLGLLDAWR
jgi:FMN phosphatase YigB (HAD superfamily)